MILTNTEMDQVRRCLETQAGLDEELVRRCGHLIHLGAFDEAVRSAFVLLEERLRDAVNAEGVTGTRLVLDAFDPENGPLAKHLAATNSERLGLQGLYSGAFRLFRNPTAHGVVGYSPAEGRDILGLVDLLLKILKRAEELPPPGLLPDNVERVLAEMEKELGPAALGRLRVFLGRCLEMGLSPSKGAKIWIPFRKHALVKYDGWDKPRSHAFGVFYLVSDGARHALSFPAYTYYAYAIGFDVDALVEELAELGFRPHGKDRNPMLDLRLQNDQRFFDELLDLVLRTVDALEDTLHQDLETID